jgi:hypothetical protein
VSPANVVTWEIPVLAKYRFSGHKWNPFVAAGPAFRTTGNLNFAPSHHGVAAGFGVETRWREWNIAPQVRYTRWAEDSFAGSPRSALNQVEFLIAATHGSGSPQRALGSRLSLGALYGWGLTNDLHSYSQTFTYIVVDGSTYTPVSESQNVTGLRDSVVGPTLEIALAKHFSVEADALHKPLRYVATTIPGDAPPTKPYTITARNSWQFPVLAKYRLRFGNVNPFIEAGPSFRVQAHYLSNHGATAGAGVEMHWRALHVAPRLRFTHWGPSGPYESYFARNEAVLLIGMSVGGPPAADR